MQSQYFEIYGETVQTVNVNLRKGLVKYPQLTLKGPGSGAPRRLHNIFTFQLLNVNKSWYCFLKLLLSCHAESVPFPYNVLFFILEI